MFYLENKWFARPVEKKLKQSIYHDTETDNKR